MKEVIQIISYGLILSLIASCAIQRAEIATKAQSSMIGMSKQQILQCMGAADSTQIVGVVESWKYHSGGESHATTNISNYGEFATASTSVTKRYCEVNILFSNDSVTNINYSGRTGGLLSKGEQCAYAVSNCVR
jgi:hypothetical protein